MISKPHQGPFHLHHNNPPPPFNPNFDPNAAKRYSKVSASMEEDNFYASHTRDECREEWRRRYEELKLKDSN
jgi:hypothetical protein